LSPAKTKEGGGCPPPSVTRPEDYFFFLEVVRLLDLRAVARFLGLRAAVVFFRRVVDFLRAVVLLAVVRLRDVPFRFRVAAAFFAARDLTADFRFRVAAAFRAAVVRFRAVVFLRAGAFLRDVDFLRAVDFLLRAVAMVTSPPRQDAMRFRRRRSRSLMPPHTPYRSSRRSA
jgi:hypothetical protein